MSRLGEVLRIRLARVCLVAALGASAVILVFPPVAVAHGNCALPKPPTPTYSAVTGIVTGYWAVNCDTGSHTVTMTITLEKHVGGVWTFWASSSTTKTVTAGLKTGVGVNAACVHNAEFRSFTSATLHGVPKTSPFSNASAIFC